MDTFPNVGASHQQARRWAGFGKNEVRWQFEPAKLRLRSLPTETLDQFISFGPIGLRIFDPLPTRIEVSAAPRTSPTDVQPRVPFASVATGRTPDAVLVKPGVPPA